MDDQKSLLACILDKPYEDSVRLVLADLLRESEHPDHQARGRFLWAGVTASHYPADEVIEDPIYYSALREISLVASQGLPALWLGRLEQESFSPRPGAWAWDNTRDRVSIRTERLNGVYTRGMLSELSLTFGEWCAIGSRVLSQWPLESVHITDLPGLMFRFEPVKGSWRIEARLRVKGRRIRLNGNGIVPAVFSPTPFLEESAADWWVRDTRADRAALVADIVPLCNSLMEELSEEAGDRWPSRRG